MYIDLNRAKHHGLDISIEAGKGGVQHLVIQPIDGQVIESLQVVHKELVERFNVNSRDAEFITDDMYTIAHNAIIWSTLKSIDDSKP